jgi:molecular chaperone GrpE
MPNSHETETDAESTYAAGGQPPGTGPPTPDEQAAPTPEAHAAVPDSGDGRDELTAELARIEDRYRRALADLDNYRKRTTREIERRAAEARKSVIEDWLHVVDSVERALRLEPEPCVGGMRALMEQVDVVLAHEGVERVGAPGDPFDPERHEAIAVQPSDELPDRTVVAVERSGFALGDRVIRPAQVVVARAPEHAR